MRLILLRRRLMAVFLVLVLCGGPTPQAVRPAHASTAADATRVAAARESPRSRPPSPILRDARDRDLQRGLERMVTGLQLARAVSRHQLNVTLVDVTDLQHPRLASLNGDTMMYAASLPKIAILLGAFQKAADGRLQMTDGVKEQLTAMIRYSSNTAATQMLNLVGKEYLAGLLQSDRYKLYDVRYDGGLWVGKEYARKDAWRRDPLHNISHGATSNQVARFFYMLDTGQLVSPEASRQMKEILGNPGIEHKFVKALHAQRPGSDIYRKSGTWRDFHADAALVERDGRSYIAVVLAHHPNGADWCGRLIIGMDNLIFNPARRSGSAVIAANTPEPALAPPPADGLPDTH